MIVKNEEHLLARCLKSFEGAFDELNVVDTGSTDSTAAVATQFGARVRSFTECNGADGFMRDFALARNASLDMASHEWILWMDADHVLQPGGAERLRGAVARGGFAGLRVTIENVDNSSYLMGPMGPNRYMMEHLFKNEPRNRFHGRIHEIPRVYDPIPDPIIYDREIRFLHLPDKRPGKNEPSAERNLRIGEDVAREDASDGRNLYYLGESLRYLGRLDEAIVRYEQYLALGGCFRAARYLAARKIAECHFGRWRTRECIDASFRALRIGPGYAESYCLIADCFRETREYDLARDFYRRALACREPPAEATAMCFIPEMYDEYPRHGIALCDAASNCDTTLNT